MSNAQDRDQPAIRIGVDLGGTKIESIVLGNDGRVLDRRRTPTPRNDYDTTIATVAGLVDAVERDLGRTGRVGVGIPGTLSRATGLVKNANSTWLNGRPLDRDLAAALGRPVRLQNDANCFAVSEAADGAAAGAGVVFGVILGTGVGAGLVIDGRPLDGPNGIAGEWGHNPLPWPADDERPGPPCYCGLNGCIETFLSGPGFAAGYSRETGCEITAATVAERAAASEPAAVRHLERYVDRLARGLAHVINILDPDVIVLGGGLSNLAVLYEQVPERWQRHVFSDRVDTRLVPPRHGDSSGVRGAAWLWRPGEVSGP
ncbi:MAG: ROK family protein [Thalassobaculum sp.]|uniref:ROK family protein n=1 Tax=Thalassobaculum sp. TaxID=2022740 RepID=UPI0032EB01FC